MSSLSPFDLNGISFSFGLYRPRRLSYTCATQNPRQRRESYRHANRSNNADNSDTSNSEPREDFIEGIQSDQHTIKVVTHASPGTSGNCRKKVEALRVDCPSERWPTQCEKGDNNSKKTDIRERDTDGNTYSFLPNRDAIPNCIKTDTQIPSAPVSANHCVADSHVILNMKECYAVHLAKSHSGNSYHSVVKNVSHKKVFADNSVQISSQQKVEQISKEIAVKKEEFKRTSLRYRKNLILLCVSFIFVFSAFRAIQNLQSSLNQDGYLGIISLSCVHGTAVVTGIFVPIIINKFRAKCALSLGMFFYLIWIGANMYPQFFTLIPSSCLAGIGQGILWTAEMSYIIKLAFDVTKFSRGMTYEHAVFRFHGVFIACFQTTHMWGNLISSLYLGSLRSSDSYPDSSIDVSYSDLGQNVTGNYGGDIEYGADMGGMPLSQMCGVMYYCTGEVDTPVMPATDSDMMALVLWQLMLPYLIMALLGFLVIIFFLDGIGAQVDPEKTSYQLVTEHIQFPFTHKTFRLLIPLLIFSGFEQGFIFADFNKAFVTCSLGIQYVGYCMITLGVFNILSAVLIAVCVKVIPREAVLGFGSILHIGLMIGYLVWLTEPKLVIFLILAAAWGICDAVWLTQCNSLICITCQDNTDVAFACYRIFQSLGLFCAFSFGTFMCVSVKLYILITLLLVSILFYVLAEYRIRNGDDNSVMEEDDR